MILNAREEFGQLLKQLRLSYVVDDSCGSYMGYRDIDVNNIEMGVRLPDDEYLRCLSMFVGKRAGMRRVFRVYDRLISTRDRVRKTLHDVRVEPLDVINKFYCGLEKFGYTCCPRHEEFQTCQHEHLKLMGFKNSETDDRRVVAQLDPGHFVVVKLFSSEEGSLATCKVWRGDLEKTIQYWNTKVPFDVDSSTSEIFHRVLEECLDALIERLGTMSVFCKRR